MTSVSVRQAARANQPDTAPEVHFVTLERLPDELQFPDSLADRIWFDENHKRLAFRGFMSKATYDRLDGLANDGAYQRALDELFRQSVYEESDSRPLSLHKMLPIAVLVIIALLAIILAVPLRFLAS